MLSGKAVVVIAVVLVAVFLLFLMPPAVNVNQSYSVSFGSAELEKKVLINGSQHIEEFEVSWGEDLSLLVVVPKKLVENASNIAGISHNASLRILEIDPILKFSHKDESPFRAKLEFGSANEDICTLSLLLPNSYLDSIDSLQFGELNAELLGYGEMNPTCNEAKEIEEDLVAELESVFAEDAELKGAEEGADLVLQLEGPKHGLVLSALRGAKARAEARRQAGSQPAGSQENKPVVSIFFEDSPERVKEKNLASFREKYTFLKDRESINLSIDDVSMHFDSSKITESYYTNYLVFPESITDIVGKEVTEFDAPEVSFEGLDPFFFDVDISKDQSQVHKFEVNFKAFNAKIVSEPTQDKPFSIHLDEIFKGECGYLARVYVKVPNPKPVDALSGSSMEVYFEEKLEDGAFKRFEHRMIMANSADLCIEQSVLDAVGDPFPVKWVEGKGYKYELPITYFGSGTQRLAVETKPDYTVKYKTKVGGFNQDVGWDIKDTEDFLLENLGFAGLGAKQKAVTGEFMARSFSFPDSSKPKASGKIVFTYKPKELLKPEIIKVPINVWLNPCKSSIEERASNLEIYGELVACYEAETRKAKMVYMADVQSRRKELDEQVQKISKSNEVILISPPRLSDILKRFKEGFNYSQISSGINAGRVTEFQDEIEIAEHPWLAKEREQLELAEARHSPVLEAIAAEDFLCDYLKVELGAMEFSEQQKWYDTVSSPDVKWVPLEYSKETKQIRGVVDVCQSLSTLMEKKFLADAALFNDPFSENNRKEYVEETIKLQRMINLIEHEAPCWPETNCIVWDANMQKTLFDNLDKQYGSNKELVKRLGGEQGDLQARIKYLEEIKPTWVGYLNPFVSLSAGLEAVGDGLFEGEVNLSREEYKKQIEGEILDLKRQISGINGVTGELYKGNSLIGTYSKIREKFKGKTFKEAVKSESGPLLEMWVAFYNNSVLRGELRAQRMLLGKDFLENIEEAQLLYSTIHALEMERDSILAFEILLDAENDARLNGKKTWREANLVYAIRRIVELEQGKHAETTAVAFNLSREREGIKKILEQLREGVPLLDIFETNWGSGPTYLLDLGIPKVINSDLTLLLKKWDKGDKEWEIEAFAGGFEAGTSSVAAGGLVGFKAAPGLVVKAKRGSESDVEVSLFVDGDYYRYFPLPSSQYIYQARANSIASGKSGVYTTTNPDILLAIDGVATQKISVEDIRSSDEVEVVEVQILLFEKSAVSKSWAEDLMGNPPLRKLKETVEKEGGKAEYSKINLFYYLPARGSSRQLDAEAIYVRHGIGADSANKIYVPKGSNIYASEKFPGLAFRFEWLSSNKDLTFYNHYSDLANGLGKEETKVKAAVKATEAKKDLLIPKGLNNVSVYTQVQVRKMLSENGAVSDEKLAALLFMTAKRYERFSLWQEAISVYTQIEDRFPSTAQGKLAIAQRDNIEKLITADKFVKFAEGLTSLESAVQYVLIAGVVKVIGRVVQLTKVTRVANVTNAQPAMQANNILASSASAKLLPGATSKWAKVKAFFNYPLEDLIARPIAKGITSFRNFRIAKATNLVEQSGASLVSVVSRPAAIDVSAAASAEGIPVAGTNLRVWRTADGFLYRSPSGSLMIANDATALADAALKTRKAVAAMKYLEKAGKVSPGSTEAFSNALKMLDDAVAYATPVAPTTTAIVAQSESHALTLIGESLQPIALTGATGGATTVVQIAEGLAGKSGVVAGVLCQSGLSIDATVLSATRVSCAPLQLPSAVGTSVVNSVSVGAGGGTVKASACSGGCKVNYPFPESSREVTFYLTSQPSGGTLVESSSLADGSARVTINTGGSVKLDTFVVGTPLEDSAILGHVHLDFDDLAIGVPYSIESGWWDKFFLTKFDPSKIDKIIYKIVPKGSLGANGMELTLFTDGGTRVLGVKVTELPKTSVFTKNSYEQLLESIVRGKLGRTLSYHRKEFFKLSKDLGGKGYLTNRSLETLKARSNFDLVKYINDTFPKTGQLAVMDSGAGFLGITGGLKGAFGDRLYVTAVGINYPKLNPQVEANILGEIQAESNPAVKELMQWQLDDMKRAGALADSFKANPAAGEVSVSTIENLVSDKKYDLILDIHGPITHGDTPVVLEKYAQALNQNGRVVTNIALIQVKGLKKMVANVKGADFTFSIKNVAGSATVFEITKIPIPK